MVGFTKKEVEENARQIYQMTLQGVTQTQIGEQLGISARTVRKHISRLRKKGMMEDRKKNALIFLKDFDETQRIRIRRLWTIAEDPKSTKREKCNALKLLQNEEDLSIRRGQLAGVLPKDDSPIVQVQQNVLTNRHDVEININMPASVYKPNEHKDKNQLESHDTAGESVPVAPGQENN